MKMLDRQLANAAAQADRAERIRMAELETERFIHSQKLARDRSDRSDSDIRDINDAVGMSKHHIILSKDQNGYGLTIDGENPVFVSSVKENGAAEKAGVQQGDKIVKVNGQLVTQEHWQQVATLIKAKFQVFLTVLRSASKEGKMTVEDKEKQQKHSVLLTQSAARGDAELEKEPRNLGENAFRVTLPDDRGRGFDPQPLNHGDRPQHFTTNVVSRIANELPRQPLDPALSQIVRQYDLADPLPLKMENVAIGLLLGADYYQQLLSDRSQPQVEVTPGLFLVPSKLGYITSGKVDCYGPRPSNEITFALLMSTHLSEQQLVGTVMDEEETSKLWTTNKEDDKIQNNRADSSLISLTCQLNRRVMTDLGMFNVTQRKHIGQRS